MIKKYTLILFAGLMLVGCSSQSNVKTSKEKISKVEAAEKETEYNDPSEFMYQINKNDNEQTVIHEIKSK